MPAYILKRLLLMIPTLLGVIVLLFVLFNVVGGDPAYILAGKMSNPEMIANIRKQLGTDLPYYQQLLIFIKQVVTFNFGDSWSTGEPVAQILKTRMLPSITLMLPFVCVSTLVSIVLALLLLRVRGTWIDQSVMVFGTMAMSVSILVYIIVSQYVLGYQLALFPIQGWGNSLWQNLSTYALLPILIMLVVSLAPSLRLYRTFLLGEVNQDYVRTAKAKGLSASKIEGVHILKNASIPIITDVMAGLPAVFMGSFLIEQFFNIPGLGREVVLAVERSDFPVIKAVTVYLAMATMLFTLLADLLYQWTDPRVRLEQPA